MGPQLGLPPGLGAQLVNCKYRQFEYHLESHWGCPRLGRPIHILKIPGSLPKAVEEVAMGLPPGFGRPNLVKKKCLTGSKLIC